MNSALRSITTSPVAVTATVALAATGGAAYLLLGNKQKRPQPEGFLRYLGPFERLQAVNHHLGVYGGTVVACRYAIPERLSSPACQDGLEAYLDDALARAIAQHPMLQVGLVDDDTPAPAWVRLDSVDLAAHVTWEFFDFTNEFRLSLYERALHKTVTKMLSHRFVRRDRLPGWRIVVFRPHVASNTIDIVFVWNHAQSDGMGGKIFHETLLRCLNHPRDYPTLKRTEGDARILETDVTATNFPPSQDQVARFPFSIGYLLTTAWAELKPPFLTTPSKSDALWAPMRPDLHLAAQYHCANISATVLNRILRRCREKGTTLTALLHGIMFLSVVSQLERLQKIEEHGTTRPEQEWEVARTGVREVACHTAISLRRHMIKGGDSGKYPSFDPNHAMGNFVTMMQHTIGEDSVSMVRQMVEGDGLNYLEESEEIIWRVAGQTRGELQGRLKQGLRNEVVGLMHVVGDWAQYVRDKLRKPRESTWYVSNLGLVGEKPGATATALGDADDDWASHKATFAISPDKAGMVFAISPVAVYGGDLTVSVAWQTGVISYHLGASVVTDMEGWLQRIGS